MVLCAMKAVIPAAGLGTRLLPATKSMPKEMLPVVDKPVIQYVVEEAVESGCDEILIITGRGKRAIEDHFDKSFELEHRLEADGKTELLASIRKVSDIAKIHYVRQPEPAGLGDAVLHARQFVDQEPFAVLLGDNIIYDGNPITRELIQLNEETNGSCFSVMHVPKEEISKYGAVEGELVNEDEGVYEVQDIIEKPPIEEAPSTIATMGRYVFTPEIFDVLKETEPGYGDELQLTDAMAAIARDGTMHAREFNGTRLDIGNIHGFLHANIALGLREGEISVAEVQDLIDEA